jgi:hypothetical protein
MEDQQSKRRASQRGVAFMAAKMGRARRRFIEYV